MSPCYLLIQIQLINERRVGQIANTKSIYERFLGITHSSETMQNYFSNKKSYLFKTGITSFYFYVGGYIHSRLQEAHGTRCYF